MSRNNPENPTGNLNAPLGAERGLARWGILAAAVAMQLCLGATYSWSAFVGPLKALAGLEQRQAQLPFGVFYTVFPATTILAGMMVERIGPRVCAVAGGLLFGCGWILAGQGAHGFPYVVAGIGGLAGVGAGFAYVVPIAACVRWFPRNKGLATGVAVAGFAAGAALISNSGQWLMKTRGATPYEAFRLLGIVFAVVAPLAGAAMRNPPEARERRAAPLPLKAFLGHAQFWALYYAMFAALAAGLTVVANMKELRQGTAAQAGITAISLFAVANAAGRIVWGGLFDRVRSSGALCANLLFQALVLLSAPLLFHSAWGLMALAVLTGFNYGGTLVLYASTSARRWGGEHVGRVYGWLFSSNMAASAAPVLAGWAYDSWRTFTPPLYSLAAGMVIAAAVVWRALGNGEGV